MAMSKGVQFLMRKNKIDVIMGVGKLKDKSTVTVTAADGSTKEVNAKNIISGYRRPFARAA